MELSNCAVILLIVVKRTVLLLLYLCIKLKFHNICGEIDTSFYLLIDLTINLLMIIVD